MTDLRPPKSKAELSSAELKIIKKNLDEGRRAIQHFIWQENHPEGLRLPTLSKPKAIGGDPD